MLNLMKKDIKPLLVVIGNLSNQSLLKPGSSSSYLIDIVRPFTIKDTKILAIDICQPEKQWESIHDNDSQMNDF